MKEIKAYQCDSCNRIYKTKAAMKKHESRCFLNQENKACWMCKYREIDIADDCSDFNFCTKLDKSVKSASKDMGKQYFQKQDSIMDCEHFEL